MVHSAAANGRPDAGPEWLARLHDELLAERSIQFDLPAYRAPEPPQWLRPLQRTLAALGPYMIYLFWGIVIAGGLIIAAVVVLEMKGIAWRLPRKAAKGGAETADAWRPDAQAALRLLADADELALRGEYDAAVHLLLRRSVADIADRRPEFLQPSMTARDISVAPPVPAIARAAFGQIARVVESALFARSPVGDAGWREARGAYERFAIGSAWR